MKPTPDDLRAGLAHFYGSNVVYRHALNRNVVYTEGVQYFAEQAGAYWFLDILATEPAILKQAREFASIELKVKDDKATILVTDGDDHEVYRQEIGYTDCPEGDWHFFFVGATIMLRTEY